MPAESDIGKIEARLLAAIEAGAETVLGGVAADGRASQNGDWTTFSQGCGLYLAELYRARGGSGPGAEEILAKLNRSVDYFSALIDADGQTRFDTALWKNADRYTPPWEFSGMVWLELHHADLLESATAAALEGALARMAEATARQVSGQGRVHNIPFFAAVALWHLGKLRGEPRWQSAAESYIRRVAEAATGDGYWREHTGPTAVYNLVYVHALGLHRASGGPVASEELLRSAGAFHSRFVYPDGTLVSLVDGRVLYHAGGVHALGLPGLLQAESAAGYLRAVAESPHPFGKPASNNVTFLPQVLRFIRQGIGPAVPGEPARTPLADVAAVHRAGRFTAALSAMVGSVENRWGFDRLQHLEVHEAGKGVLLGGGLSRGPEMAFLCGDGGHLATEARLESGGRALRLAYPWGEAAVELEVAENRVEIRAEARALSGELRMLLPVMRGWVENVPPTEPERRVTELKGAGVNLTVSPEAVLRYPVKPWFPYHPEGVASEDLYRSGLVWQGRGRLEARLVLEG